MKFSRIICIVLIALLGVVGWFSLVKDLTSSNDDYNVSLAAARDYADRQLYELSIQNYCAALKMKETAEVRNELVSVNQLSYDEGTSTWSEYVAVLADSCNAQPGNAGYWEMLLAEVIEDGTSAMAYSYAKAAETSGAESDALSALIIQAEYAYQLAGIGYEQVYISPEGLTSAFDGIHWCVLDADGNKLYEDIYQYISPVNANGEVLLVTDTWAHVVDKKGVAQAAISEEIESSLAYGNGYLPVKNEDDSWSYINCFSNEKTGSYIAASSFVDGIAAVNSSGTWTLVDTALSPISEAKFDDIKLFANGAYVNDGIMIASQSGRYGMYDAEGNQICDFTAADMDVYMGGYIAYQNDNGSWGYIDTEGEEAIPAGFEQARSFSNGLAAVCQDDSWGFINRDGSVVIDYQFYDVSYFNQSGCCFISNGGWQRLKLKQW